jgi:hypothetical protein
VQARPAKWKKNSNSGWHSAISTRERVLTVNSLAEPSAAGILGQKHLRRHNQRILYYLAIAGGFPFPCLVLASHRWPRCLAIRPARLELLREVFELLAQGFILEHLIEARRFQPLQRLERGARVLHQRMQLEARLDGLEGVVGDFQIAQRAVARLGKLAALRQQIVAVEARDLFRQLLAFDVGLKRALLIRAVLFRKQAAAVGARPAYPPDARSLVYRSCRSPIASCACTIIANSAACMAK